MKRLAVIGSLLVGALALAACGSSTAPKPTTFAGSWVGYVETDTANITATQSGNAFTGSGTLFANGSSTGITFNGTSTAPSITGTLSAEGGSLSFSGTYVTKDSISGVLSEGGSSAPFVLVRQ